MIFTQLQEAELAHARDKHPPLHSLHEAYAVILEEVEEFKAEVFKQTPARDHKSIVVELAQIAAMCQRTAEDLFHADGLGAGGIRR